MLNNKMYSPIVMSEMNKKRIDKANKILDEVAKKLARSFKRKCVKSNPRHDTICYEFNVNGTYVRLGGVINAFSHNILVINEYNNVILSDTISLNKLDMYVKRIKCVQSRVVNQEDKLVHLEGGVFNEYQ